jgi:sec-independent protein translocase protein TatA
MPFALSPLAFFSGQVGPIEVIIILGVILLFFGARRLPELSRSLGRSLSEFKRGRREGMLDKSDDKSDDETSTDDPPDQP